MADLKICNLPVVSIMEGAVGDSNKSAGLGVMSVLAIALQKAKGGDEVSLL